jgi:hypothetical protein
MSPIKPNLERWTANVKDAPFGCDIEIDYDGCLIATVRNTDVEDPEEFNLDELDTEARARAYLMASAPDLLFALERLVYMSPTSKNIKIAKTAIGKARGFL